MNKHYGMDKDGNPIEVHDPGSSGHVIDKVYAIVAVDAEGGEGIVGFKSPMGWLPMVSGELEQIEQMATIAEKLAVAAGQTVKMVEFNARTELRTLWEHHG